MIIKLSVEYFLSVVLGVLSPLDFEIKGGRDDPSPDGETKFLIKEIKEGSFLHKHGIKVGDQIFKVRSEVYCQPKIRSSEHLVSRARVRWNACTYPRAYVPICLRAFGCNECRLSSVTVRVGGKILT